MVINPVNFKMIVKYLADECSVKEKEKVEIWLSKKPENKQTFELIKKIMEDSTASASINFNANEAWTEFVKQAEIKLSESNPKFVTAEEEFNHYIADDLRYKKSILKSPSTLNYVFRAAAILVVLLGITYFSSKFFTHNNPIQSEPQVKETLFRELVTKKGEKATIKLADGTIIKMNSMSKIQYPIEFLDNKRIVYLYGEAYFKVTHDVNSPFIVYANNVEIKDIGTEFNISAWPNERSTDVVVSNGKVLVSAKKMGCDSSVLLSKGEKTSVFPNELPSAPESVKINNYLAWMQGKMVFVKTKLPDVCRQLERHFNYKFQIRDSSLQNKSLTATIKDESLSDILKYISMTMRIRYEKKSKSIIFYDPKIK